MNKKSFLKKFGDEPFLREWWNFIANSNCYGNTKCSWFKEHIDNAREMDDANYFYDVGYLAGAKDAQAGKIREVEIKQSKFKIGGQTK